MPDIDVGEVLDGYRLTGLISRGPTSSIFKAEDRSGALVALKVPLPAYAGDAVFIANLAREERIGTRLAHRGVVKAMPSRERTRPYLVTEFVEGEPLRMRMHPHRPLDTGEAIALARELAETVAYLHSQRVIHRDLKPENVQLLPDGGIKILDFGLALERPRRLSWLGSTTVGTPDYMAPEQAKGLPGDQRSDIYGIGVILYEMLTGELPFPVGDPFETMTARVESDPIPPSHYCPDLSPALEEIILHAIERRPAQRYASASALAADLRDPERIRPTGRRERMRPRTVRQILVRRLVRYTTVGVVTVLALVLVVLLANKYPAGPASRSPVPAPAPR
jgi:serine/threonine protein kinase